MIKIINPIKIAKDRRSARKTHNELLRQLEIQLVMQPVVNSLIEEICRLENDLRKAGAL